ncbi:MAG: hypothetical protein RLY86_1465 [Pseudomonadota bacterium]|jgi:antitoxin ParD1/3/4
MGAVRKMVIELPEDAAAEIEERVSLGEYASASDMILAGLDALSLNADEVEHWLRTAVQPSVERSRAEPRHLLSAEEVRAHLQEVHRKAEAGEP